jgi:hypothetical protein
MKRLALFFALLAVIFLPLSSCQKEENTVSTETDLKIVFEFRANNAPFLLNKAFTNDLGQKYVLENLMFYLSNFEAVGNKENFKDKDSFYFVALKRNQSAFEMTLKNVKIQQLSALKFNFGIDKDHNSRNYTAGELNPNGDMICSWIRGYKFLSLEGRHFALDAENGSALIYHIGEEQNCKNLQFDLKNMIFDEKNNTIRIAMDMDKLFSGKNSLNFKDVNYVMIQDDKATKITQNIESMMFLAQ